MDLRKSNCSGPETASCKIEIMRQAGHEQKMLLGHTNSCSIPRASLLIRPNHFEVGSIAQIPLKIKALFAFSMGI